MDQLVSMAVAQINRKKIKKKRHGTSGSTFITARSDSDSEREGVHHESR